ncbi:MAG TPA: glutamate 5-kinase [Myxococcales bacterium]|nr:glutamate 5-kinase [Myxococcales bacterium]HAN32103.1 glutamate 5-kinase [Myxococcales bacterium]|tara:strand:+ start:224 stop:1390 length:1167 start_codon:yes stop_codon:yes gene_type:complete
MAERSGALPAVPDQLLRSELTRSKRVVLKVGSQALCHPNGCVDDAVVARLCADIAWLRQRGHQVVLVSSGAVAMGRAQWSSLNGDESTESLGTQALAAVGQALLMSRYRLHLTEHNLLCAQILLTHGDLGQRSRFLHARRVIDELLEGGLIPVVNENDTVSVEELRFGDNDALAAQIAQAITADALVLLTEVDGLYTEDPNTNPHAALIEAIWSRDLRALQMAGSATSKLGTGGMRSKVLAAQKAGEVGICTVVAHGKRQGVIRRIFEGQQEGTVFAPPKRRLSAKRKWLTTSPRVRGRVTIDQGAAHALSVGGRSLLPVGVTEVHGRFGVGDLLSVCDSYGVEVGRGLSRYTSEDLRFVAGKRSEAIVEHFGWLPAKELIHRDDFIS